ncbi:MAG TPA: response regulator transcription factor [Actinocrinis sp.]|nr:response regulator transcription factor [Actinocrinis sp.]
MNPETKRAGAEGAGPLRVVLADDAPFLRQALAVALREAGFEVVAEAGDAPGLVAAVAEYEPDVAIVDVRMPPGQRAEGLRAALDLRRDHPATAVLLLSAHLETQHLLKLLDRRGRGFGYLLKERVAGFDQFAADLRTVSQGGCVIDPDVAAALVAARRDPVRLLSPRELDVLHVMAEGRSNSAISSQLNLELRTVESHVRHIFVRLDIPPADDDHRRVLAVLAYLRAKDS